MKIIEKVVYGEHKNNVLDIYLSEREDAPLFVYFHGGGLEGGSYKTPESLMEHLAEKGINCISAEYRMYPEAKYPDYLQDAANVIRWVKDNFDKYTTYRGIFVGGSSAGGYISQMLCFDEQFLNYAGLKYDDIAGYIHDAGQPTTHFNVLREYGFASEGGTVRRVVIDEKAPIYHIDGSKKYPPMIFFISDNDMPNRYEQTKLIVSTMKNYDYDMDKVELIVMENTTHCSYTKKTDENGQCCFANEIYRFIKKSLE